MSQQQLYHILCTPLSKHTYRSSFVFWGDFVLGGFCPDNNFVVFFVHHYGKHSYRSGFVFWGNFVLGGFCPNNKYTIFYVHHYGKHSYRSSFVFWEGFCSGGDFVLTTTLPYSMYSITVNIHIEQHMVW